MKKTNQYILVMTIRGKRDGDSDLRREDLLFSPDDEEIKKLARDVVKSVPNLRKWELFKKIDGGAR